MRSPSIGVGFLQQTVSLPSHTFVSIYAIHWLQANMENMTYEKATSCMEVGILIKRGFMVLCPIILKIPMYFLIFSEYFQRLLREKMICHASGDTVKRFIVGYYMYHILPQKKDKGD